jgi:hypothetical protein
MTERSRYHDGRMDDEYGFLYDPGAVPRSTSAQIESPYSDDRSSEAEDYRYTDDGRRVPVLTAADGTKYVDLGDELDTPTPTPAATDLSAQVMFRSDSRGNVSIAANLSPEMQKRWGMPIGEMLSGEIPDCQPYARPSDRSIDHVSASSSAHQVQLPGSRYEQDTHVIQQIEPARTSISGANHIRSIGAGAKAFEIVKKRSTRRLASVALFYAALAGTNNYINNPASDDVYAPWSLFGSVLDSYQRIPGVPGE